MDIYLKQGRQVAGGRDEGDVQQRATRAGGTSLTEFDYPRLSLPLNLLLFLLLLLWLPPLLPPCNPRIIIERRLVLDTRMLYGSKGLILGSNEPIRS